MSEQEKDVAKELGARAARQSQQAAKNTGRAARASAHVALQEAGNVAEKVNDMAEETVDNAVNTARKVSPRVLSRISGDTGTGFLALSVALYASAVAYHRFGSAFSQRRNVIR